MEHKSSNFRHFNCLSFSVILHSLLFVGLAFAPAMMVLKSGMGQGDGQTIDVAVVGAEAPAPQAVEVAPAPVAAAPAPVEVASPVVVAPVLPEKKVVEAKKPVPKKPAPQKIQQTIKPQPVVEVAETLNEDAAVVADSDANQIKDETLPEKDQVQEEKQEEVAPVVAAAPIVEEAKPEKVVEKVETPQAPVAEPKPVQQVAKEELKNDVAPVAAAAAPAAAQAAKDNGNSQPGGQQGNAAQAAPIATAADPQNFLNLRQAQGNKPPLYTRDMRFNKLEGRGQLQYYVTKSGTVSQVKVTQSTGNQELDRAAVDAFSKYKFVPGQEGYTVHNFEFTLKGPAEADAGRLRTTYK
jgi:periplasmic protein TonB